MYTKNKKQNGQIVIMAIIFFALLLTMSTALMGYISLFVKSERQTVARAQALELAEAAIDKAVYELNQSGTYAGENNTPLGNGSFTITVSTVDNNTKAVTATGYVPDSNNPIATRTVKARASINTSLVSFRFGVQVGDGGVIMGNGAKINGNMFSNGSINGGASNGAAYITGDATVAGGTQATPEQQWTTQNSGVNLGDITARADLAQSFRLSSAKILNKVSLYLKKTGTPSDITLKIVADNNGKPSNTVLASGSLPASSVSANYSFVDGTLATSPSLAANTTYWIIAIAAVNSNSYFTSGLDNTDAYTLGTGKSSPNWNLSNPTWSNAGGDLNFKAYVGGVDTFINGMIIGGTAWAHTLTNCQVGTNAIYQSISNCSVGGTQTVSTADASPSAMPISNGQIEDWEAIAESGGVVAGNYTLTGNQSLGPKKIDGDLLVNGTLYMTGPIWVKGNVTFANNSGLIVHASTGANGAVIIGDSPGNEATKGVIMLSNNMTIAGNGSPGSYPMVLSTNSGTAAITMNNNATSVILYASRGTVNVINNAIANQITAYALNMSNNTTVNYINGLQSQSFSNGPGGSWGFVPGTYVIVK